MTPSIAPLPASPIEIPVPTKVPLQSSGSLKGYEKFDVTPVIGTEFARGIQLTDLLSAPNSDHLIRDLAILGMSLRRT
jgi:hypothetical protein